MGEVGQPKRWLLLRHSLWDQRRAMFGWSVGIFGTVTLLVAMYPTVRDTPGLDAVWENAPEGIKALFGLGGTLDISSGVGYLRTEVFGLTLPLLLLVRAIGAGAGSIAGDEERGVVGQLLSLPVSRSRILSERFLGQLISNLSLGLLTMCTILSIAPLVRLDIGFSRLLAATSGAVVLATLFGTTALLVGCVTGRRSAAVAVSSAAAVCGFLSDSLAGLSDRVSWLRVISPFHWASPGELILGGSLSGLLWCLAAIAIQFGVALVAFRGRDLKN